MGLKEVGKVRRSKQLFSLLREEKRAYICPKGEEQGGSVVRGGVRLRRSVGGVTYH